MDDLRYAAERAPTVGRLPLGSDQHVRHWCEGDDDVLAGRGQEARARGSDLGDRVEGLDGAAAAARGRLDDALVDDAEAAVERAAARLRLSADHTVVALAGATGSGKSSTFNALAGLELAAVGVRRPTTSWATACVWGSEGAGELLEWLGIPPRHQVMRDSHARPRRGGPRRSQGVVLLDLPDHDSTEVSHHLEVDRLVELADLMVWVLDPQKYADAAIHDRYLAPLATPPGRDAGRAQPHRRGARRPPRGRCSTTSAGCSTPTGSLGVPVLATSRPHGEGIDELRARDRRAGAAKKVDPRAARGRRRAAPRRG